MITFIVFIIVFSIIILVHEFGHFITAKFFDVRVDEFAIGFPPRIWAKKKKEITYSINAIPLGGFVRLFGEGGEGEKSKRSLVSKKTWQKTIIFAAGVGMNFLMAWSILFSFYLVGGQATFPGMWEHSGVVNDQKVYVTYVEKDSPAEKNGIEAGDVIKKVNGNEVYLDTSVIDEIQKAVAENKEKPVNVVAKRDEKEFQRNILTGKAEYEYDGKKVEYQKIGVNLETRGKIKAKWYMAPVAATAETWRLTKLTMVGIADMFKTLVTRLKISENVVGPAGIVKLTGVAAGMGFGALLQFVVILSISLGVINIMPIPVLDGGHVLFLAIEKVRGKPVPVGTKNAIQTVGFGLLLLLVLVITISDIGRFNIFGFMKGIFGK